MVNEKMYNSDKLYIVKIVNIVYFFTIFSVFARFIGIFLILPTAIFFAQILIQSIVFM